MEKRLKSLLKRNVDHEQAKVPTVYQGEASKLYFACRNGDIDMVKKLLSTIPYDQINQLESNGSTALHAATYFGHAGIVRLLLYECGCQRDQKNFYGLTAYEEAQTDGMREIFYRRSDKNRFSEESNDHEQIFQIVSSSEDKVDLCDNEMSKPNEQWLTGYQTNEEIKKQLNGLNGVKTLLQSRFGRCLMKQVMKYTLGKEDCGYSEEEYAYLADKLFGAEELQKILDEHLTINHPDYQHACCLLEEFIRDGKIESLLTLYSMETPFYHQIGIQINPLAFPLFMHLPDLKERYYQGRSYRGVQITHNEFKEYRWALKNKDSVIATTKFASTSIDRQVAEQFAAAASSCAPNQISVLLIFDFPRPCDTAINLGKIPEYQLSCISNFENEHEVLLVPRTFFQVKQIETNTGNDQRIIYLENVSGEQRTVLGTLKFFLTQELKNRIRH